MDEPCSALDPTSTRRIEETIRRDRARGDDRDRHPQHAAGGPGLRLTAFFLADEGEPGRIVEFGPTGEIFSAPNDPRTEDYIHGRFG